MIAAAVLCVSAAGVQVEPKTYLADLTALMRTDWPKNRTINIVCHGHSVPAGYAKTPIVNTFGAYPMLMHKRLAERFPHAVINVIVTAIGGETSEGGAKRFEADVLPLHPDLITIDYSLNDRFIGLPRAKAAWTEMIEAATRAKIKVILLTPTPDQSAKLDDPNDPLNQQADQVRSLAKEFHVGLVDSLVAFKSAISHGTKLSDLMAQSNHPNEKGHEIVARELDRWFP
jgi:lysophospholipase L1-like esterase